MPAALTSRGEIMKAITLIFVLISILTGSASGAGFCACCVERGYYEFGKERPDAYVLGILDEMKFHTKAELYMTEAGFDGVRGLNDLKAEIESDSATDFNIVESFLKRAWTLNFTTAVGKKGTIRLRMPTLMTRFKVDTREEGNEDRGLGVSLYKEFSFIGRVASGTGIFRSANTRGTTFHLVFQGNGNGCDSSADFRHWRLELKGPGTRFAILGKLDVAGT
jgi:hypothetical protein